MRASPGEENVVWRLNDDHQTLLSNYTCSTISFPSGFPLEVSPEYLDYRQCACLSGFFGIPPNRCDPCPLNAQCGEGGHTLSWPTGYFPIILGK